MTPEERENEYFARAIYDLLDDANESGFSDVKQHYQLTAIAYGLMWIAEELHEMNERSKGCTKN